MFKRLVGALDGPQAHFFVHVDRKSSQADFETGCQMGTITFERDRLWVNHCGYTQVLAMLRLLELANSTDEFDYFIFLSGRDYPIKSNAYILKYLTEHKGTNFISFYPLVGDAEFSRAIRHRFFIDELTGLPSVVRKPIKACVFLINMVLPSRKFVIEMIPYRGSTSWCLTGDTAKYIVEFARSEKNQRFVEYFRRSFSPDEMFFQTVVLNSAFARQCRFYERDVVEGRSPLKNENLAYLHYIDWSKDREDPALLDMRDYESIKRSEALFARKFSESTSKEVLDQIDRYLRR